MLKLKPLSFARQHLCNKYLQPQSFRFLSVYPSNDRFRQRVNDAKRTNTFNFYAKFGILLGTGYICLDFYHKMKSFKGTDHNFLFKTIFPEVEAATGGKDKSSPRAMFNFLADVADKTASSVVYIEMVARHPITAQDIPLSNGSGFIVRSDGLILTNAHVVSHHGRVKVKLYDGKEYEGTVEHYDNESDLATVRIKAKDLPVLPLGQSSKLRAGEFVIAMGNPLTLSHTITAGVVSSANRPGKDLGLHKKTDYIQTDAAVNIGNSGGPLVNLDCEAIGINTMKVTEGISFAIPSDRAVAFLNRVEHLQKNNEISHATPDANGKKRFLGITMLTLTPSIVRELQEVNADFPNVSHGVMVWRVMVKSPSYEAGIKVGDVITSINGSEITSASEIYKLLTTEDILSIHVVRRKKELDIVVHLMDPVQP